MDRGVHVDDWGMMDFSTMVMSAYLDDDDSREADERVLAAAIDQALAADAHGFNPWFTEHHFRGAWNSAPMQFAAFIAPQISPERYVGFGVLLLPFYHPVRLVEQMNLLDQLMRGRTLFGFGSGFVDLERDSAGLTAEYHGSGQATRDNFAVVDRLWAFENGNEPYEFATEMHSGRVERRVLPSPYRHRHPTFIRTARNDDLITEAARRGWPAFLGTLGSDVHQQAPRYFAQLEEYDHPPEILAECKRWSTVDWFSVVVAESDEEAYELAEEARAERLAMRQRYYARTGETDPFPAFAKSVNGPLPSKIAEGGDPYALVAGSPDSVAEKVQAIADLGVNHMLVRFLGEWHGETRSIAEQSMRLFSEKVMPRFA